MDAVNEKVALITGAANEIGAEVASDTAPRKSE
jgi:short-subunit dehydrogenase